MPRLWAVGFSRLAEVFRALAGEYAARADVRLVAQGYDAAVDAVRQAMLAEPHDGADVVIAAGSNGAYLRRRVAAPVVLVGVDGFDALDALATARQAASRVALLSHGDTYATLERYIRAYGLDLPHHSYRGAVDADARLRSLREEGVGAVVGPGLVTEIAEQLGMQAVLLYSEASVRAAFDTALTLAQAGAREAERRATLDAVLGRLREGVIALDERRLVITANPAACRILACGADGLVGQVIDQRVPALGAVLCAREDETIQTLNGRDYWVRRRGVALGGTRGAVLTIQAADDIARGESSLRSQRRPGEHRAKYILADLYGNTPTLLHAKTLAARYARTDGTVLIHGETGTGKEVLAQGLHRASLRANGPFVAVNCGALPETLLESELFGYEEGAFTGARRGGKPGLIEAAHHGTLFLDEIGEMPLALQTRLLRVLQEREVTRLGAVRAVPVDARIIAASHRELRQAVAEGSFRADLFYRLNVLAIALPPLAQRRDDIAGLAARLLSEAMVRVGRGLQRDSDTCARLLQGVMPRLREHDWPGNVRELAGVMERVACLWLAEGAAAPAWTLEPEAFERLAPECLPSRTVGSVDGGAARVGLRDRAQRAERDVIEAALAACGGDRTAACRMLGISRSTLWRRLR